MESGNRAHWSRGTFVSKTEFVHGTTGTWGTYSQDNFTGESWMDPGFEAPRLSALFIRVSRTLGRIFRMRHRACQNQRPSPCMIRPTTCGV